MERPPHIILINGTSGSGKTSLCRQLTRQLYFPYVHLAFDQFCKGLPQQPLTSFQRAYLPAIYKGFLASVQAYVSVGNRALLDIVLINSFMKVSVLQCLADTPTYLIGLECSLEKLKQRNAKRKNRRTGLAAEQAATVHEGMHYDLYLDTGVLSPAKCADQVIAFLDKGCPPRAFSDMMEEFTSAS